MKFLHEFVTRDIAGEKILVPVGNTALDMNGLITVNEVGARILELMPEAETEEDIVKSILDEYEAPEELVRRDVTAFLGELRKIGLIA